MKKGLLALGSSLTICLSLLATDMVVKQKNGEDWKINVDEVEEVVFEETIPEDSTVVDASETFLLFNILSDSTAEVIRDESGNDCSYLGHDSITIPEKVRIDGKIYTVTSIGKGAFIYNFDLTYINIPESVTNIGQDAFYECSLEPKLLVYDKGTKCYGWIGDKKKCTEVVIPEGVTSVGASAFSYCSNLTSVNIPEGVTSIGEYAFYNCNGLEPKLLVYDKGTKCYGWIGDKKKCTEVVIPEGVTSVGASAFSYCSNLTSVIIPESVTSIGKEAFNGCNSLEPELLFYDKGTKCYGWIGDKEKCIDVVIPEGVTSIVDSAFYWCNSLASIKIPKTVTSIGKFAFYNCTRLKEINIPSSLTNIGEHAFHHCSNLRVIIDNSKKNVKVGTDSFTDCSSVTFLKDLITLLDSTTTKLKFKILTDSTVEVINDRLYSNMSRIIIPSMIQAIDSSIYIVTNISNSAFSYCTILTSINIPEGITSIGEKAFYKCSKLTSIEIPCSVTDIEGQAFENCSNLDVAINNSKNNVVVGTDAFEGCKSVTWLKE